MRVMPGHRLAVAATSFAVVLATAGFASAGQKSGPVRGEVEPGSALVYFIRTGRFVGSARTMFLFADEQFLGVLDNGTYAFAQVSPGKHLFWTNWTRVTKELELVPGRTYYLDCWSAISVLDPADGEARITQVGQRVTPTPKETETAARYVRERHGKAEAREAKKGKASVEDVELAEVPEAEREGMALLPAWTEVPLELLEGITSAHDATGARVAFRVARDVAVDGAVLVRAGTPVEGVIRQAAEAKAGGVGGVLDVAVPSVPAADGTALPVVGLVAEGGRDRSKAATGAMIGFGIFGALAVQGREAYHLRGETVVVTTREDAWLVPAGEDPATTPSGEPTAADVAADVTLEARAKGPVEVMPAKEHRPPDVTLQLETATAPTEVRLVAVGGRAVSPALRASRISPSPGGAACAFDGWSVGRLLEPDPEGGENRAELRGTLEDGRSFVATTDLVLQVRQPQ